MGKFVSQPDSAGHDPRSAGAWDEWSNPIDKGHWWMEASRAAGWQDLALLPFTYFQHGSDFSLASPCLYPFAIPNEVGCSLTQEPRGTGLHDAILGRLEDGFRQRDGVTHHGTVEPILRHHTAPAPALLPLPPFGPAVLEPHLEQATRRDTVFVHGEGMPGPFPCRNMHVLLQHDESRRVLIRCLSQRQYNLVLHATGTGCVSLPPLKEW